MSFVHKIFGPSFDHDYHSLTAPQKMNNQRKTDLNVLHVTNSTSTTDRKVNIAVVGNPYIGKTKLVESFTHQTYTNTYVETSPRVQPQEFSFRFQRNSESLINVSINIWDIPGRHDNMTPPKSLEALDNPMDVVIFIFSIDDENSYTSIIQYWLKHMWKHCNRGDVEFIVVGAKSDLRTVHKDETTSTKLIAYSDGMNLSRDISARRYIEVSAAKDFNTIRALEAAIEAGLHCQEHRAKEQHMKPQGRSNLREWLGGKLGKNPNMRRGYASAAATIYNE